MRINKLRYFFILVITGFALRCSPIPFDECRCNQINIYGRPSNILVPVRVPLKSMLELNPKKIDHKETIELLTFEILSFEKETSTEEIDNRFVLEFYCQNRTRVYLESNSYISRMNGKNFRPTKQFLNLVKSLTRED